MPERRRNTPSDYVTPLKQPWPYHDGGRGERLFEPEAMTLLRWQTERAAEMYREAMSKPKEQ
jgi:hypothetical protein